MAHYLTAFIYSPLSQERVKFREMYPNLKKAKQKLAAVLRVKRRENWVVEEISAKDLAEIIEQPGNIVDFASAKKESALDTVIWTISTEEVARDQDGEVLPDYEDMGGVTKGIVLAEQGFIPVLWATIKMYPGASAGIGAFLFWLLFL